MGLPAVTISKPTFSSTSSPNVTTGILAICAASSMGTLNQPSGFARSDLALTAFGQGPLVEYCAYNIAVANTPTVLVKMNATYAGSYNGLNVTGKSGSSVVTTTGAPYDHYNPVIVVTAGGTIGTPGIMYTYSLDGGNTVSGVQALGSATSITIPNSGVTFNLGSGTLVTGDTWLVFTERPLGNDTDVTNSLTALFNSRLPFEGVYVDSSATSSTVGLIDVFLSAQEAQGVFKFVVINTRYKLEPEPTAETEAAYATALQATFGTSISIQECVGADGAHVPSVVTGLNLKRPTGLLLCSRAMSTAVGIDPAYVALGAITGAQITDSNGNPFDHDEGLFPGLDAERFTTLRSFPSAGPQGVYITNANTIQPTGGSYPYLQHIRIMNEACSIAWQVLTTQLSRGVRRNPKPDPVTGATYILESDAATIEGLVNSALAQLINPVPQVSQVLFTLSRTDNLNIVPATVTGFVSIVPMAYIKNYNITAQFVKSITAPAT